MLDLESTAGHPVPLVRRGAPGAPDLVRDTRPRCASPPFEGGGTCGGGTECERRGGTPPCGAGAEARRRSEEARIPPAEGETRPGDPGTPHGVPKAESH